MSKFLCEIRREIEVRLGGARQERETLSKAAERIAELDALISEAEGELASLNTRIPVAVGKEPARAE